MCHFITAVIESTFDTVALEAVGKPHAIAFSQIENAAISRQLASSHVYLAHRAKRCDCGTVLGSLGRSSPSTSADRSRAREIEKRRRRGWSETKITRWLTQQAENVAKEARADAGRRERAEPLADAWLKFVRAAVTQANTKCFGLLLHWYSGGVETEKFEIAQRCLKIAEATTDTLLTMEEDTLYLFE